jgi:hypothetical protein
VLRSECVLDRRECRSAFFETGVLLRRNPAFEEIIPRKSACTIRDCSHWRTKGEYATLLHVVLRTCTVAVKDLRDVEHSIEVTAETLYEAIATALAALQQDNWVGEIGQGFATVTVLVQQPPVKHEVKLKDFVSWLGRQGRSPAEVMLKQKLEKILGKVNHART